jgi:hypothetical protein
MNIFHFHQWIEYVAAVKDPSVAGGKYSKGSYRHCEACGRWQRYACCYGGCDWEDCQKPSHPLILESAWDNF